jgi:glutathione-regulated potassium-efflux system protein KefB
VVLLLFTIGLELSPRRLWLMRKPVFEIGLALSSTVFGLQTLADLKQLSSPHGRLAFAILLFP